MKLCPIFGLDIYVIRINMLELIITSLGSKGNVIGPLKVKEWECVGVWWRAEGVDHKSMCVLTNQAVEITWRTWCCSGDFWAMESDMALCDVAHTAVGVD